MSPQYELKFKIFNKLWSVFFSQRLISKHKLFFFYEETLKIDRNTDANGKRGISSSRNLSKEAFLSATVRMKKTRPPWMQPWQKNPQLSKL